jgi:DNA helicase-2/ATP-dependent DNA helicase PcrA
MLISGGDSDGRLPAIRPSDFWLCCGSGIFYPRPEILSAAQSSTMTTLQSKDAILDSLNEAQREAVTTIRGPLMTLAGPGSGKTRVVTHRIAHMIEQGIPARSILAMTFTNKAAQTIRERMRRMVGEQPVTMGTFHGFGARFLRRYGRSVGLEENFSILDTDDSKRVLEEAVVESQVLLTHVTIAEIAREISRLKTKLITPDAVDQIDLGRIQKILREVYPVYQKRLLAQRAVDFDDLLLHPAVILRTEPDLRAELDQRHQYILVDEYQDTNFAQYVIVRALSIDYPNINVTGDPDQSIYSWRGADIENIFSFERDYPDTKIVRLEENYRSTPEILSLADSLIQNNRRRKAKVLLPTRDSGTKVKLVHYLSDEDEAEAIADQIKNQIIDQGAKAKDFAVLYRTNAQSRLFEKALLKRRLNYQLIGGFRFYQRQEIKDLLAYLRLVHNPRDDTAFDRIINTPSRGLGAKTLDKIAELARGDGISRLEALGRGIDHGLIAKKAAAGGEAFLRVYTQLIELSSGKLVPMLKYIIEATQYLEYLKKQKSEDDDEKFDANINELLADARQIDEQSDEGSGLVNFLEQVSLLAETDLMGNDADRVTLMTLHAAKGLEFPNVFVVAVEQDVLPHARCREHPQQVEEERRLFFVGITRAENRLQLSTAAKRGFSRRSTVPSQFLMEIPRLELEIVESGREDFDSEEYSDRMRRRAAFDKWSEDQDGWASPSSESSSDEDRDIEVTFESDDFGESQNRFHQSDSQKPRANFGRRSPAARKTAENAVNQGLADLSKKLKSGASVSVVATLAGADVRLFLEGSRVSHPEFGAGRVLTVEGYGPKRRAVIQFGTEMEKTFILACSPLSLA